MSATLNYPEPHRFSAGVLALLVHLVFFSLLYFGVHRQPRPNEEFMVEMWSSLPNTEVVHEEHPPEHAPPARTEPKLPAKVVAPVSPPAKAEIEMREKKSRKAPLKEQLAKKNETKEKVAAKARQEAELKALQDYEKKQAAEQARVQAVQNQVRAEVSRATQVQVDRYQDMIRSKIRSKMVKQDVPGNTEAIFKVTLLPDGTLMDDPVLIKSSGYTAYDEAAARAILSAEPLPVPADATLQKMFRELKLSIRP